MNGIVGCETGTVLGRNLDSTSVPLGAFYHVIVPGTQREQIFRDNRNRLYYLERVEHYRQRYWFKIHAYVLMSNHAHLLLETSKTPLSKILQGIQFTYT
jgi:putative transposase